MHSPLDLSGQWAVRFAENQTATAALPGTLDENGLGFPDTGSNSWHPDDTLGNLSALQSDACILTRLTRTVCYEGKAFFTRSFCHTITPHTRVFLEAERSRKLSCSINGVPVSAYIKGTLSTPYRFELTDFLQEGENELTLCCDNSYPDWPHDDLVYSSAATDETQTNWNGVIGKLELRTEKTCFARALRLYPLGEAIRVEVELDCGIAYDGFLQVESPAFSTSVTAPLSLPKGVHTLTFSTPLSPKAARWDEDEGNLHQAVLTSTEMDAVTATFGIRTFGNRDGRLALNDRVLFLRSEANCCVFPETGHMPMEVAAWRNILSVYLAYGVNCLRFHSHCPPEAAFQAADEMGLLLQPELSHWNPRDALETAESQAYYELELRQILWHYANHPSFVMLTFGNELHATENGHRAMAALLSQARALDPTRLYANGSNVHYGQRGTDPNSDFFTASEYYDLPLRGTSSEMRGHLNHQYPNAQTNYNATLSVIRTQTNQPVFSFEVGQYEVLPDFAEWNDHRGVTRPDNYRHVQERVAEAGFSARWQADVAASGELALLAYREEVEAVLRTPALSGISLLGLQDFPGQGTALVGMLNAHLQPKPAPFADPARFASFFRPCSPLVLLPRYTYFQGECLQAELQLAHYGKQSLCESATLALYAGDRLVAEQTFPEQHYSCGKLHTIGQGTLPLQKIAAPAACRLVLAVGDLRQEYPLWVYPNEPLTTSSTVHKTASVKEAIDWLSEGKTVFLEPQATKESFPHSIAAQFTTDFWSVGTFPAQEGFMGCRVDPAHPVFDGFPTESHSNWQWWAMCQGRAMILPPELHPLITGLDCYAYLRSLGLLVEARVGNGLLMLSSMGLAQQPPYPEVLALRQSILCYMDSAAFDPHGSLTPQQLLHLVQEPR